MRKERVQDRSYVLTSLAFIIPQTVEGLTLVKSSSISIVETFLLSICRVLIPWARVLHTSATDRPAREPRWSGLRNPVTRATEERRRFLIRSIILEKVWRRTITWKEEGES